ncbi:MAG: hypothetical protein Q8L37_05355 [Candidatus Gottesmanbacteria bacterium]|nr:hypothetical protein [Candidatus Gottesmanbacteria bacterium]
MPEAKVIVLDSDDRLSMMSVTNEYNQVALLPDDQAPILSLAVGEVVEITFQPDAHKGRPRHVFVERKA